jgi:glycosyltransferase involved in cell wall biosynthesis
MKITIDASQIIYETGVSVYTKNLIKFLLKIDKVNTYQIIGGSLRRFGELGEKIDALIGDSKNGYKTTFPFAPTASEFIFNRLGLDIDPLIGKPDVFHSSDWTQPKTDAFKVTTIHDLIPFLYPKLVHPKIRSVHIRRMERVKRCVDKIIVPSLTTRGDLMNLGIKEDRIVVIPEAVDNDLKRPSTKDVLKTQKKYRISDKYLLSVGTSPRKNIDRIITAFERVRTEKPCKLVIVGEVKKHSSVRNVMFLGHIPTSDMAKIYCGAEALIYPSLYEGFGLPILEAYALGVPVLTSNIGSLKEVGTDASMLVDPYDVDSITQGINELLLKRNEYIKKGKEAVKKYSWEETAKKTLAVYEGFKK